MVQNAFKLNAMKKQIANTICCTLSILFATNLFAQNENTWRGGKPGRTSDWNVSANWSKHRVPNEFDHVVIPNTSTTTRSYPFISGEVTVGSLFIESGAEVVLRGHAMLVVLHWQGSEEGDTLEPAPHALQIEVNKNGEVVACQGARQKQ